MSSTNTIAGRSLRARLEKEGKPLVIDKFVFACVPEQDHTLPADPAAAVPAEQVVYTYVIPEEHRAYITPDQVVYSAILGSDLEDFDFNWQGLVCSEHDTLIAYSTFPKISKIAYNPATNTPGNNFIRNHIVQFADAQAATGITIEAEVWQLDFTVRLKGIDERERLSNRDIYGRASFLDDGWKLTNAGGSWRFEPGRAYVEGIRLALSDPLAVPAPEFPCSVWLDVSMRPEASDVITVANPLFLPEEADAADYVSNDIFKAGHYLEKVAHVDADGNITDLRNRDRAAEHGDAGIIAALEEALKNADFPRTLKWGAWSFGGPENKHPINELTGKPDLSWALCDGGTYTSPDGRKVTVPDLRDRFVIGAGGSYAIGATGGDFSATTASAGAHTHAQGNTGATTLTVAQIPAHGHSSLGHTFEQYSSGKKAAAGEGPQTIASQNTGGGGSHYHTNPATGNAGGHTHTVKSVQPFYAAAVIMKL